MPPCSSTTITSTSPRAWCARGKPDAKLMHFVHIPWPQPDTWRVLPRRMRSAVHDGLIANDVIGFHTDRWRRNFIYCVRGDPRRGRDREDGDRADLRRRCRVRRARAERRRARGRARDPRRSAREARRPRRPDRSVEEHRARVPARSSSTSTGIRRCTDASRCSRCSTRRGRTSPSTRSISRRSSVRRAASTGDLRADGLDADRARDRGRFPQVGGGLQAVRRAARQRDLRRDEPRRQGGAAREQARRRRCPVGKRRRARRAR